MLITFSVIHSIQFCTYLFIVNMSPVVANTVVVASMYGLFPPMYDSSIPSATEAMHTAVATIILFLRLRVLFPEFDT